MLGKSRVALASGKGRSQNIAAVLAEVDAELPLEGFERVIIKPNLCAPWAKYSITSPEAVGTLLEHLRGRFSGEIWIMEGAGDRKRFTALSDLGYDRLARDFDAQLKEVGAGGAHEKVDLNVLGQGLRPVKVAVDKRLLQGAFVISITPPKTHDCVNFTSTIKNLVMGSLVTVDGCRGREAKGSFSRSFTYWSNRLLDGYWPRIFKRLPVAARKLRAVDRIFFLPWLFAGGNSQQRMHKSFPLINANIALIARSLCPGLGIVDGYEVMEGDGPISGDPLKMDFALASTDCVAVDATAARIMSLDPCDIGYLYYCALLGLGRIDPAEILISSSIGEISRAVRRHYAYESQLNWSSSAIEDRLLEVL